MKRITTFLFLLFSMMLTSCTHFNDGTSVWAGGLWLIFWIPFLGSFVFAYYAYKAHESGYRKRKTEFDRWEDADGKLPYLKIYQTWFAIALQVIAWGVCIGVNFSR
jgi:hypothetical protein